MRDGRAEFFALDRERGRFGRAAEYRIFPAAPDGLVFIAAALQQVWQKENGVMVLLPPELFKALDEPEVLIIVLLTTGNGGSMVFDLTSLYRTVFEGNLCVGDDEYGDPVRTEAFALRLVEKLKYAKTAPEKAPLPIEVFESVGCEGAVLATRLNPLLYEN